MLSPSTLNQTTLNDPWTIFQLLIKKMRRENGRKEKVIKLNLKMNIFKKKKPYPQILQSLNRNLKLSPTLSRLIVTWRPVVGVRL